MPLMAELQGIFCSPFLPSVLIIEEVGRMGGGVGWDGVGWEGWVRWGVVGGGKNYPYEHSMSSHGAHTMANNTTVGYIASGSK